MTGLIRLLNRSIDRWSFGPALLLSIISLVAMASAAATQNAALAMRQGAWVFVGVAVCMGVMRVHPARWIELAPIAYGASLALLAFVFIGGTMRLGATRWISLFGLSVQPAELAKLATVLCLARYLAGQPRPLPTRSLLGSLGLALAPAFLIFKQPDLGTASVLFAIWVGMMWAARCSRRQILGVAACVATLLPLGWHVLRPYQRDRLLAFVDPHADPLGTGYTIIQSKIAIGSGGLFGRGWFSGTQNQLSFLPERHSDFIFSVIGEEWGLLGCVVVLAAFCILLGRILSLASSAADPQGRFIAVGIFSWIGYQAFVNIGMVTGLLPVVGVPLPCISYGGSSMVMIWLALGMLQGVRFAEEGKGQ